MVVEYGENFADVYRRSLMYLMSDKNSQTSARGLETKEITNMTMVIENPLSSLYSNPVRGSQKKYIAAELMWYFLGRDDVNFIQDYAKFWLQIQNEDGSVNSSYGKLLFDKKNRYGKTQYEWALESLKKDMDSRQAVIHFNLPEHQYDGNKDFVCTMYGIFQIRNNKLNLTITMRSNDAIWGTPTDVAFFTVLQQQMLLHLKGTYPDLELGTYTHIVNSFHVYSRHYDIVEKMLAEEFTTDEFPVMGKNLIQPSGKPTMDLRMLHNHFKEASNPVISDGMFLWIQNNINS